MLSIGKLGEGQADYYCGRRAGVEGDALHAALDGEHPKSGESLAARRGGTRVPGFDLTFSETRRPLRRAG